MSKAKNGDTVRVHYTGKLEDGTVFDSSAQRQPLRFTIGERDLIAGFEAAVEGMASGDTKTVQIPADQAYGPHRDELVFQVPKDRLPGNDDPQVGQVFEYRPEEGEVVSLRITEVAESTVTFDANHPLAGQELTFELELVEIVED